MILLAAALGFAVAYDFRAPDEPNFVLALNSASLAPSDKGRPKIAPECVVGFEGKLQYFPNPSQLSHVTKYFDCQITATEFICSSLRQVIPLKLQSIAVPIETWPFTKSCFTVKHLKQKYLFCAPDPESQATWLNQLYEAIYCIYGGEISSPPKLPSNWTQVKLPATSDIERRMVEIEKSREAQSEDIKEESSASMDSSEPAEEPEAKEDNSSVMDIDISQIGSINLTYNGDVI